MIIPIKIPIKYLYPVFWVIGGIMVTLFFMDGCKKEVLEYWEVGGFKTDTQYVDVPYEVIIEKIDTFEKIVPPIMVIKFRDAKDDGSVIDCQDDSLIAVIDSLGNKIKSIDKHFLTRFPNSFKLIYGLFTKDSLNLNVLKPNGDIYSLIYGVNYNRFKYQWINNEIRAEELDKVLSNSSTKQKRKFTHGFYLSPGYDILDKNLTTSLNYILQYKRFRGDIEGRISIETQPTLMLHGKIGIKLAK